jgi:signal transduction histidine kinase
MHTVREEIDRINTIVEQYLQYARPPGIILIPLDLRVLMDELSDLFSSHLEARGIHFRMSMDDPPELRADKDQLKQALINIIKNAEESIEKTGEIIVRGRRMEHTYDIEISDTGQGIPGDAMQSVFDFHFSTKSRGSGIGLTVVQQIIEAHGGTVDIRSKPGKGTVVSLHLLV